MDPISIAAATLSASKSLYSLIGDLTAFAKATKQVDQAIRSLEALGLGLAGVLANLTKALKQPILNNTANASLFVSVHDAVHSCQEAVQELESKLKPIKGAGTSLVRRAWRAHQLGLEQTEIDRLTAHLRTHSINLQLALQTVNVIITASIPGAISASQTNRFDRLEQMLGFLQQHFEGNDSPQLGGSRPLAIEGKGEEFWNIKLDRNTSKLYSTAASIVTGTASLASRAAPSEAITETQRHSVFEIFPPAEIHSGMASSEFGSPLDSAQLNAITNWIPRALTVTSADDDLNVSGRAIVEDEDEEDELEFLTASSLLKKGAELYDEGQIGLAREHLARGLTRTANLSPEKAKQLQLTNIRLIYGLACTDQGHYSEAETNFHNVIETSASDENASYYCNAMLGLAVLELRARKLNAAITHCRQAIRATSRALGTNHAIYFDCVRILSLGFWAKGDEIEARAYCGTLPKDWQIAEQDYNLLLTSKYKPYEPEVDDKTPKRRENLRKDSVVDHEVTSCDNLSPVGSVAVSSIAPPDSEASSIQPSTTSVKSSATPRVTSIGSNEAAEVDKLINAVKMLREKGPRSVPNDSLTALGRLIKTSRWYEGGKRTGEGLYFAAQHGKHVILEALLSIPDAEVNCQRKDVLTTPCTPLTLAAMKGHSRICETLLHHGADPTLGSKGQTPLSEAVRRKQYHTASLLLTHNRSLFELLPQGLKCDLLLLAVAQGDVDLCRFLLQTSDMRTWRVGTLHSALPIAARGKNRELCKILLAKGASIDGPLGITYENPSPLMEAARNDDTALAQFLLAKGAKVDGYRPERGTPLVCAAAADAFAMCRLLLENGANKTQSTLKGPAVKNAKSLELKTLIFEWPRSASQVWAPDERRQRLGRLLSPSSHGEDP